jgi:LCP family protein required for cell wall assembly
MKKNKALKVIAIILVAILIAAASAVGFIFAVRQSGYTQLTKDTAKPKLPSETTLLIDNTDETFEWIEADVYYNGEPYRYRDGLICLLLLGVDKNSGEKGSHQADAIYLGIYDTKNNRVDIIAISRNTYATIDIYDISGNYFGEDKRQICLAYGFGEDDSKGSELTTKAVSRLLYNLPIQGYYTIFMDQIAIIVDAVGGVTLTLDCDMTDISKHMTKGATVTLDSKTALRYLRWRDETNAVRVNNQILFMNAFVAQLKSKLKTDPLIAVNLLNKLSDISVTNLSAQSLLYLMTSALTAEIGSIINIEGTSDLLNGTEVVYLDEKSLYMLVLEHFYEKIN